MPPIRHGSPPNYATALVKTTSELRRADEVDMELNGNAWLADCLQLSTETFAISDVSYRPSHHSEWRGRHYNKHWRHDVMWSTDYQSADAPAHWQEVCPPDGNNFAQLTA